MKNFIITAAFLLAAFLVNAQLKGSGKTITKTYDYKNFDKINLNDFDGKIEVEVGKPFEVSVSIDDNLVELLNVIENKSDQTISLSLKGNYNNKLYIEDTKIKIKISLPKLISIAHRGNSGLTISDYKGENLKIENSSNGSISVFGQVTNLEIKNDGNGNISAERLVSQNAKIKCTGNGNVKVNTSETIEAKAMGNCSVFNIGKGKFSSNSTKSGNARLIQ